MVQKGEDGQLATTDNTKAINSRLAEYRDQGVVDHSKTLAIPPGQRIPELIKEDNGRDRVCMALSASILSAFGHVEKAKMNAGQIIELAEAIIDSSHEDQLSIEDVLLFLRDMLMGKYGKITEKLDMPMFFDMFEKYRDKRYKTLEAIRYERHLNLKSMGHTGRSSGETLLKRDDDPQTVLGLMQTYYEAGDKLD